MSPRRALGALAAAAARQLAAAHAADRVIPRLVAGAQPLRERAAPMVAAGQWRGFAAGAAADGKEKEKAPSDGPSTSGGSSSDEAEPLTPEELQNKLKEKEDEIEKMVEQVRRRA
jgi:hypothetical protein